MKVLVTGGTGFVGRQVLRHLTQAGHSVRVLVRRPESSAARTVAQEAGVGLVQGDVLDPVGMGRALQGMEAVVHLVGIIAEAGRQTFDAVHVKATGHVVAAARSAGVVRLVHMSALGTRPGAASRYHQTKWAAEQMVRRSGLAWTVFRPSMIYGPQDAFVNLFARMSRWSPVLPVIGPGTARMQPVTVESVARAFAGALAEPRSVGQALDLCGPQRLTLPQVLDAILAAAGRRRLKLRIPLGIARVQAMVLETVLGKWIGVRPPSDPGPTPSQAQGPTRPRPTEAGAAGNRGPATRAAGAEVAGSPRRAGAGAAGAGSPPGPRMGASGSTSRPRAQPVRG